MLYYPGAIPPDRMIAITEEYNRRLVVEELRYRETIWKLEDEYHRDALRIAAERAEDDHRLHAS